MFATIEGVLVGLVGRPILLLIKWLRWPLLGLGFYFNAIVTYDPATKQVVSAEQTIVPFIVGFILFCVGMAVKRYDSAFKDFLDLTERLDESPLGQSLLDP